MSTGSQSIGRGGSSFGSRESSNGSSGLKRRNFFQQEENGISIIVQIAKRSLFTGNHLMIQAFQMHHILFFLILIVEYLQLAYFALHDAKITESFKSQSASDQSSHYRNLDESDSSHKFLNWDSQYNVLNLLNYQLLIIDHREETSLKTFYITLFVHLSIFIILLFGLLILGQRKIMRAEEFNMRKKVEKDSNSQQQANVQSGGNSNTGKSGPGSGINDIGGTQRKKKIQVPWQDTAVSYAVFFAQTFLVIPTFYLYSTIFNCTKLREFQQDSQIAIEGNKSIIESNNHNPQFECLARDHIIIISVSSFLAIIVLGFLAIEALIFQDLNMKSPLPWRMIPSRVPQLKLLQKLICVFFNFQPLTEKPIAIGILAFFTLAVLVKRYQYTRIYWKPYRNWIMFTEFSIFWFAFWNFLQKATSFTITIYSFSFLIMGGLIPYYLVMLYIFTDWKFERLVLKERSSMKELGSDVAAEDYFGYLLDLIKESQNNEGCKILLYGLLRVHWYSCKKKKTGGDCYCNTLIQRIDKIEQAIEEEAQSRQDAFDILKIQQQINFLEEEMSKQEDEEIRNHQQRIQLKQSTNMQKIMEDIRNQHQINSHRSNGNQMESGRFSAGYVGSEHIYHENDLQNSEHLENQAESYGEQKRDNLHLKQEEKSIALREQEMIEDTAARARQKTFLRRQIKLMFYKFVYQLMEEALSSYSYSFRLKYLAAFVQYYLLQNEIKGLFEVLMIEKRNKVPFEWQFFIYKVKIEIEDYMDLIHRQRSSQSGRIDVKKVYLFAKNLQDFENQVETISDRCLDFWKELLKKTDFDANNLHKVGTEITLRNIEIVSLVNNMFEINPHHGYLLRIYSLFLLKVMNNDEDSEKYNRKFLNAQKTFQTYEAATLQEELIKNFSSNIKYVIIVMRVSTQETGIVEDVNHEVKNLLGYRRNDIIGKNIQMIMPKCIGNLHDQFIQNYLDTAKPKILNKQREVFALKKNGFIVQCFVYATSVPMIECEGIKFVGFLKKVDEKKFTEILPPPSELSYSKNVTILAAPNGNIYGLNDQAFKLLGFPKYFTDDSDDKHSDYNMSQVIKNYSQILFDCFKHSPTGQIAIIDTEPLKPFIVPDLHSKKDINHMKKCHGRYQAFIQAQPVDYGYKGGAYLPMVVFRVYLIKKLQQSDINVTKYVGKSSAILREEVQSPALFKNLVIQKLSQKFSKLKAFVEKDRSKTKQTIKPTGKHQNGHITIKEDREEEDDISEEEDNIPKQNKDQIAEKNLKEHIIEKQRQIELEEFVSSASSMSASHEGKSTDVARLREFRKMVNSRKEPQTVIFLRRFVLIVTALIASIISINTGFKMSFFNRYQLLNDMTSTMNIIAIDLIHIYSGFRTLINIHNDIQLDYIPGLLNQGELSTQMRGKLAEYLFELNENKNVFLSNDNFHPQSIASFTADVLMNNIQSDGVQETTYGNLNLALGQVVSKGNNLLLNNDLNKFSFKNRTFISYINSVINQSNPKGNNSTYSFKYGKLGNEIDQVTKDLFFIHENIYDTLTDRIESILREISQNKQDFLNEQEIIFFFLISTILVITVASVSLIFYIVRQIHKARIQSLSLYSELDIDDVREVVKDLNTFMRIIKEDSELLSRRLQQNNTGSSDEEEDQTEFQDFYEELNEEEASDVTRSKGQFQRRTAAPKGLMGSPYPSEIDQLPINQDMVSIQIYGDGSSHHIQNTRENPKTTTINSSKALYQTNMETMKHYQSIDHMNRSFNNPHNDSTFHEISKINDDLNSSAREVMNDSYMSQRQLNLHQFERKHKKEEEKIQEEIELENAKKVGNVEKFKMVKSKSSFRVISTVVLLFSFAFILVAANFALFIPMYRSFKESLKQEEVIIEQFKDYYKIYLQVMKDLVNGQSTRAQNSYQTEYQALLQNKFEAFQEIMIVIQTHSEYMHETVSLASQIYSKEYCSTLLQAKEIVPDLNITFCQTVDNQVSLDQGFHIQMERMLGEIGKIRLQFEEKPINFTKIYKSISKDFTLATFQLMMDRLFTPTFYLLNEKIDQALEAKIKQNQNAEISILAIFIMAQLMIVVIAWPQFLRNMNNQISKSRGILTLIPSRLIISNENIRKIIQQNKLLTQ